MMKTINFYTYGDSNDISTWSNVPYLFAKTLEEKGYRLNRVSIYPTRWLMKVFNALSFRICIGLMGRKACPTFQRTMLHRWIIDRRLKKAVKVYGEANLNLFLSYSFVNRYSKAPNILWCDWPDLTVIRQFINREPRWYEKKALAGETKSIQNADMVFSLFSTFARKMSQTYGREVVSLKRNVVNTVMEGKPEIDKILERRKQGKRILFVGGKLYRHGALRLLEAVKNMREKHPDLILDIVGMTDNDLPSMDGVKCWGYLNKGNEGERDSYYELLTSCRCLVNPTPTWGAYSSSVEAMYYGCPVVVSAYEGFVDEFGNDIDFGYYCDDANLEEKIDDVLTSDRYDDMCRLAHENVGDYTWSAYVDEMLGELRQRGIDI